MTPASVIEGHAGRAVRRDLRGAPAEYRDFIVDEWTIQPERGGPWQLVTAHEGGVYLLTLSRIDVLRALVGLVFRRARNRSVEMALTLPIEPQSRAHARAITREIARAVVDDGLPLPPSTDRERGIWAFTGLLFTAATGPMTAPAEEKA
ncbi:hypothetical protein AB0N38_14115 [Micromonospora aurantiaca]|uniref:hypothetical protein n=1 Tax=Micromonospora aurantiaca (nom. illeg.) TaxID=47850 RepID=UPI00343F5A34